VDKIVKLAVIMGKQWNSWR